MLHLPALLWDSALPAHGHARSGTRPRVLVVEPRHALRSQMGLALRRAGLDVDFADGDDEARACARAACYAAAVLDVDLAQPGGLALCRDLARGARVPVVAACATATLAGRLRARLAGARACLVRPMDLDDFVHTVWALAGGTLAPLEGLPRGA